MSHQKNSLASTTNAIDASSYAYDGANRLTSASYPPLTTLPIAAEAFTYDGVGNRLSDSILTGYQYNVANRLIQNSSYTYTYDANGNMTSRTTIAGGVTTAFSYDSQNRLTQVSAPSGTLGTYKYDAFSNRVEKDAGGSTIRYVYDGNRVLAELDGNNNLIALFTNGPIINETLAMRVSSTTADYFLHADALGSIVAVTGVNANVVETVEYQAYGQAVVKDANGGLHAQSTVENPRLFSGAEYDPEVDLLHMGLRAYSPEIGRFLQADPLSLSSDYTYALNEPLEYVDPRGLAPEPPPSGPDGQPLPPPVSLPNGKNGQPNEWVPAKPSGTGGREQSWKPAFPVPSENGGQPRGSWDPEGHWDIDWGDGGPRRHYSPNGEPIEDPHSSKFCFVPPSKNAFNNIPPWFNIPPWIWFFLIPPLLAP